MFSGIIEELGKVQSITSKEGMQYITIRASQVLEGSKIGDSIAVNGVCLTVLKIVSNSFTATLMPETAKKTTLSKLQKDDYVNLERALKLSDRMGGHIITGHIDHIGRIHQVEKSARSVLMSIHTHQNFITYLVEKGSVAIDGISLTVLDFRDDEFRVSLLPFTLAKTTLGFRHSGDNVNLEGDVLAKYAIKLIHHSSSVQKKTITLDLLEEYGYFS